MDESFGLADLLPGVAYAIGVSAAAALSGVAAWVTSRARKAIDEINDAVNHRHARGPDSPKLYDAVLGLHERTNRIEEKCDHLIKWREEYKGGPLDTGAKAKEFVIRVDELEDRVIGLECVECEKHQPLCKLHRKGGGK